MAGTKLKVSPGPRRHAPILRKPAPPAPAKVAMARLMRGGLAVQPILQVGAANDPAEREADSVADRVLSGPALGQTPIGAAAPAAARTEGAMSEPEIAPLRRSALDQPSTDALKDEPNVPAAQEDFELPKTEDVDTDGLSNEALTEIETGQPTDGERGGGTQDEPVVAPLRLYRAQKDEATIGPDGGAAPPQVAAAIRNPGAGRPLPRSVRSDLEPRFGSDFSDVRLHDSPRDRKTAGAIGARAFAYGSGIWLGDGERAENRKLMAHELTHVIQQTGRDRSPHTASKGPGAAQPRRKIHRLLGDAILEKIESYARHIPGYTLISYALGKTPIAQTPVKRTPENLIYAVMGLHPLGTLLADRLKEARVIPEAAAWLSSQIKTLNLTWPRVQGVVARARELFSILNPLPSIKPAFAPLTRDIFRFVSRAKDKIVEFIFRGALKLAGPMAEKVWGVIKMAGNTIKLILDDPLQFAKNLFRAVTKGFGLFFSNILKHLKKGLLGFIFGALDGIDIQLPEKLNLQGIVSIIFQVLRLTWANIRKVLVKKLGPNGERKVAILEKTVDIIRLLITKGVMGIWKKMLSMIDNLTSTVMTGIISFITGTIIKGAIGWLAGLSNPVGAVVKICLMIYDFVVMLLERLQQIMDFVKTVFSSIAAIAKGNIDNAAKKVEDAIGRTVPLILAFLAALIPVTGIASKIQSIMRKLRKPIDRAINKLVGFLVKKGKKLLSKVIGKLNGKRKLPETTLKVGKATHKLYGKKKGKKVGLFIRSEETERATQVKRLKEQYGIMKDEMEPAKFALVKDFILTFERETAEDDDALDDIRHGAKTKVNDKETKEAQAELNDSQKSLEPLASRATALAGVTSDDPAVLLRYETPVSALEGKAGTHKGLSDQRDADSASDRVLDADHNPPLASLHEVRQWLKREGGDANTPDQIYFREKKRGPKTDRTKAAAVFGQLSIASTERPGGVFPAMLIYGLYNAKLAKDDQAKTQEMREYLDGRQVAEAARVKAKLKLQLLSKIIKVREQYAGEPQALKDQVEKGLTAIKTIATNELKLGDEAEVPEQSAGELGDLVRGLDVTGQIGGTDFMANEGKANSYGYLSGNFTLKNFLEADHMPMHAEMAPTPNWTVGMFMGSGESSKIRQDPAYQPTEEAGGADVARIKAKKLVQQRLQIGKAYSQNSAGAVVVAATINQHASMKDNKKLSSEIKGQVASAYTDQHRASLADGISKGRPVEQLAAPVRSMFNARIRNALRARITARQAQAYDLYISQEAPKIKRINQATGNGDKAVGVLAQIAARVKSSETTAQLMSKVNTFFPV